MTDEKRLITAEDLYKFELISGIEISPNGKHVIYAQQRVDQKTEKTFSSGQSRAISGWGSQHSSIGTTRSEFAARKPIFPVWSRLNWI